MSLTDRAISFRNQVVGVVARSVTAGTFQDRVESFVAQARQLAADGLSLADAAHLFTALMAMAVDQAKSLANSGADKKQFVLEAVGYLYDAIAPNIWLPWFVAPFRVWLRPYIREFCIVMANGMVEAIYARQSAA